MTEVVEMFVGMHCEACASSVKRAMRKIPGVESHKIDFYAHKVTVMGKVDREDVRRRIQKTGKQVTLIPKPAPAPPKAAEEQKEEKPDKKKDEKKEEKKEEVKAEEKKEEEKKEEKKVVESKAETIQVRKKSMYWPAVQLWRFFIPREVKVHEKKQEVVTKVEAKEEKKEEAKGEGKTEEPGKKETVEKVTKEPEWVPMFVSAPFYTLPSQIQYF